MIGRSLVLPIIIPTLLIVIYLAPIRWSFII